MEDTVSVVNSYLRKAVIHCTSQHARVSHVYLVTSLATRCARLPQVAHAYTSISVCASDTLPRSCVCVCVCACVCVHRYTDDSMSWHEERKVLKELAAQEDQIAQEAADQIAAEYGDL